MGVRAPILLLGGVVVAMFIDAALALVMVATFPLILFITVSIAMRGVSLYSNVQRAQDGMVRVVREDSQGIRVIKALSKVGHEKEHYDEKNAALSAAERRAGRIMAIPNPIMTLLMNLGICGVVALSAYRVNKNLSSPASVIAFMQYFTIISLSMLALSRIFVSYTKCRASGDRIAEVMETADDFYLLENSERIDTDAYISFENVNFSYFGVRNNLENVNFSLKKGERLGIIGGIGSGKSTLIRLLMRLYDVDSGRIVIDGRDIRSYPREELVEKFGVTLQSDFLYSDTITENIRFGRDISDGDIEWAARVAQAQEFIEAIPDGYSHVLAQRGTNLSGGQRQRLLIARAIASHPDILILDDASSALDYRTDAALRSSLSKELSGTTVITVAQRVSSVKNCDMILVLEEGRVIGAGKHQELLDSCPEYEEISRLQMGGDIID
jgi:ATP-binding cassette subfamily B protein